VFYSCTVLACLCWMMLIFFPSHRWTRGLARMRIVPVVIATIYTVVVVAHIGAGEGGFFSLDDVATLFENRAYLLAGWIHYLSFDLFVGSSIFLDAQKREIGHPWLVVVLLLTLWVGPVGLLAYTVVRRLTTKNVETSS
jgi:hypothetical protein